MSVKLCNAFQGHAYGIGEGGGPGLSDEVGPINHVITTSVGKSRVCLALHITNEKSFSVQDEKMFSKGWYVKLYCVVAMKNRSFVN